MRDISAHALPLLRSKRVISLKAYVLPQHAHCQVHSYRTEYHIAVWDQKERLKPPNAHVQCPDRPDRPNSTSDSAASQLSRSRQYVRYCATPIFWVDIHDVQLRAVQSSRALRAVCARLHLL